MNRTGHNCGKPTNLVRLVRAGLSAALACLPGLVARGGDDAAPDPPAADAAWTKSAARAALDDGLFAVAEKHFRALLGEAEPGTEAAGAAALGVVRALHAQAKPDSMLAVLDEQQPAFEARQAADGFLYWRAAALAEKKETAKALDTLRALAEQYPESAMRRPGKRLAARIHLENNRTSEALAAFERFDRLPGAAADTAANLLAWGRALVEAQRASEAAAVLSRLLAMEQDAERLVWEARYWLGRARMDERRWTDALAELALPAESSEADDDVAGRAHFARASVYIALTNAPQALAALSNGMARARSPDIRRLGRAKTGALLLETGRIEDARPLIQAHAREAPHTREAASLQLLLAEALLDRGDGQEAAREFQRYLEAFDDPAGQAQATRGRGWALYRTGHYAESADSFRKAYAMTKDPANKSQALFKAGDASFANGQFAAAAEIYEQVVRDFSDSPLVPHALFQQGQSLAAAGKTEEAMTLLLAVPDWSPDSPFAEKALFRTAELLEALGRTDEAIQAFARTAEAYPKGVFVADAMLARGLLRYRQFAINEALADFEAVVRDFPDTEAGERAFYMRGLCHYRLLRDKEMLAVLNEFLQRYPESNWTPQAMFRLGQYWFNQERFDKAEDVFLDLAAKFSDHALADHALLRAGNAAARRKEYLKAIASFARVAKSFPESRWLAEARFGHAEALRQLGRYSEAILFYDELRTRHPDSDLIPLSWLRRGDCQFMLGVEDPGRYGEALQSYRAVAGDPAVQRGRPALAYEAEYKIGRCLEKKNRPDDALDQYYSNVMIRFLHEREKGVRHDEAVRRLFERASIHAVDILEARKDWRQAVAVLERSLEADVSPGDDIRERIRRIRSEYFWLFY